MIKNYATLLLILLTVPILHGQITIPTDPGPITPTDPLDPVYPFVQTPVGTTEGNLEVTLTGAALYNVPIKVPAGENGIQPQINLQYNSQSGNGIAGLGWSISGVSSISRVPSTIFHDGKVSAVDFSKDDRFALDGQRLLLKTGTYGGDGAEYETENYSNIKITSHGISPYGANYGPKYFKVSYPDGSVAMFGNSDNSRSKLSFGITNWTNRSGIKLVYDYIERGGNILISKIRYGSTIERFEPGGPDIVLPASFPIFDAYLNEVNFEYYSHGRAVKEEGYVGGSVFNNSELLSSVESRSANKTFRKYLLGYDDTAMRYNKLAEITEYNGVDEQGLSPLKFTYKKSEEWNYEPYGSAIDNGLQGDITAYNYDAMTGDFDADGELDYILFNKNGKEYWINYTTNSNEGQYLYRGLGSGRFDELFLIRMKDNTNTLLPYEGWVERNGSQFNIKTLNNGAVKHEFTRTYAFPKFRVRVNSERCVIDEEIEIPKDYYSGDFNGDGLTDIFAIERDVQYRSPDCYDYFESDVLQSNYQEKHNGGTVYILNLNDSNLIPVGVSQLHNYSSESKIVTGHFLGSSKTDVLVMNTGKMTLHSFNGTNFYQVLEYSNSKIKLDSQIHLGDFNGDGKLDIMLSPTSGAASIFYSTGKSFQEEEQSHSFRNTFRKNIYYEYGTYWSDHLTFLAVDFNNDGKTDIINFNYLLRLEKVKIQGISFPKEGRFSTVKLFKNMGYYFQETSGSQIDNSYITIDSDKEQIQFNPIPIIQTPKMQFSYLRDSFQMAFVINNKVYKYNSRHNSNLDKQLLKIENGDGRFHGISYEDYGIRSSSENPLLPHYLDYEPNVEKYPNVVMKTLPNNQVVSAISVSDGNKSLSQSFSYASPVFDSHGLGFLGFKGIVSTNWYDKPENMYKNIKEFDITKRGALKKESVILGSSWSGFISNTGNGLPLRKPYQMITTYENENQLSSNKVFKLQNTKTVFTDYAGESFGGQFIKEVHNIYNSNNDITKQTTFHKFKSALAGYPASTVKTEIIENNYIYGANSSNYYMSRLAKTKKTQTIPNQVSFTSEDSFVYDDKGRVLEVRKKGNNIGLITEKNTYDHRGNIIEKSVVAGNLTPRVTKFKFGYNGRFVTEKTDVTGLKTLYNYDGSKGLLIEETNPFGQKTKYSYDNWGKQVSVIDYLGKKETSSYRRNGNTVEVTTSNEQGFWEKEFFDSFGNKIKVSSKNLQGEIVNKNYEYDAYNRIIRESDNYIGSVPSLWTTTEYDRLGRISKITNSKGKEITTTYSLSKTTIRDGVTTREEVIDAAGNVVSRKDAGGTINYKYFSNGSLKSTSYDGIETVLEQDGWGRKTKLIDPSAGVYSYEYNALGELIKETTPKGTTQFTIDDFGRITKKTILGDETNNEINYTFDETTQLLTASHGLLNGQAYSYTFGYDSHKRLNSTVETTPYAVFTKNLTFDAFGRTAQETFKAVAYGKSSERKVKHNYKNGYHWQLVDVVTNQVLTEKYKVNSRGLLTDLILGNGLQINNFYDVHGYLIGNTVNRYHVNVFKLTNTFDIQRGNLLSRTNSLFNRHETFNYDDLDRLVSFTNKAGVQESQYYDTKGRIEENNLGAYGYSNNTSYQLGSIELNAEAQSYYQLRPEQSILYNAFKSPVWIKEQGKENVYFDYNANNQRSTMYYGNEATNKTQSTRRKHYSADGSMEVTYDVTNNTIDFVTYIDGDAYSATVISKGSDIQDYFYLHRDYLGSILAVTNRIGLIVEKRHFDAWGNLVFVKDLQNNNLEKLTFLDRGYTGHEHLQGVSLIHMNGRLYDPVVRRFLAPDNFVQDITNTQNFNRYGYVLNNPLKYTDESGEFIWMIPILTAGVFAVTNLAAQAFNGEISNFWDGAKAFGSGAATGFVIGSGVSAGLSVPLIKAGMTIIGGTYAGTTAIGVIGGLAKGLVSGDWSTLGNTGKILAGNFYLDSNRSLFGQTLQGISRFSWEFLQNMSGYSLSQLRNAIGTVDKVGYFGGATFSVSENKNQRWGISMGNYINMSITDEITEPFRTRVLNDHLFMHEYGHTKDSFIFGLSYLFAVGIPSGSGAEWTEYRANVHARKYFRKYYGVDFNMNWKDD